jgi:hypothetical protein
MIETDASPAFEALAGRLEQQAAALAEARAQASQLARTNDPARWRRPDLVWPIFAGAKT